MSRDLGPPERVRGGSSKIGRDPSEYGSVPALLPRRCAIRQAVIPPHNSTPSAPETVRISTGCRKIQALPSHGEGDPTKSGEIRAKTGRYPPFSHVGALYAQRPSHGRTVRPPRPPKPLGSRPDVARSRPSRATARGILQNRARSGRRRVGTRPSPTSVRGCHTTIGIMKKTRVSLLSDEIPPYTLRMPGGIPLVMCTLPIGVFYLLTYSLTCSDENRQQQ
jgi:hypothetical protein